MTERVTKKIFRCLLLLGLLLLVAGAAVPAQAATTKAAASSGYSGWKTENGKKRFYVNGKYVKCKLRNVKGNLYYFNKNGYMLTGTHTMKGITYYFQESGRLQAYKKGSTYYWPKGGKMSKTDAYDFSTFLTARSIAAKITTKKMSKSQKLLKCFKWVMAKYYITKRPFTTAAGWMPLYANDHFQGKGGTCLSDATAFAYLAAAIGYTKIYACLDSRNAGGHAWTEINGKVYDPLFAQAKSFSNNYGVRYGVYKLSARYKEKMRWVL
ncbi:MAG: hypothetical protein IJX90_03120 [Blautia sp.]|nr:hypothetical protein [Blautia sp.]